MSLGLVIGWVLCGLLVCLLARVLLRGAGRVNLLFMVLLSIAGALLGGLFVWLVGGSSSAAWPGWILAVVGAVIILRLYGGLYPKRWWQ